MTNTNEPTAAKIASQILDLLTPLSQPLREEVIERLFESICQECGGTWDGEPVNVPLEKRCRCVVW